MTKDMNQFMYDRWMDMPMLKDQWLTLPCGHVVSREHLRMAGGLCPVCEQNKDEEEFKTGYGRPDQPNLPQFPTNPRRDI